jgi:hypothetical protein
LALGGNDQNFAPHFDLSRFREPHCLLAYSHAGDLGSKRGRPSGASPRITADEEICLADTVIVATGASAKWLGIPTEEEFRNDGVSACATCDGALFKGREVLVVGGGDTAMEEANDLTHHASKVTLIHRRYELRASRIMVEKARNNPKIAFITNATIDEILGQLPKPGVTGARLQAAKRETRALLLQGRRDHVHRGWIAPHHREAHVGMVQAAQILVVVL